VKESEKSEKGQQKKWKWKKKEGSNCGLHDLSVG